jgi:hypothetical protein
MGKTKKQTIKTRTMNIQSIILRPYENWVLSEDGWDITQICGIAPVPHRLYKEKRLFAVSNDYMFVCLKLYDSVDELNTSILEHDEFLLQIETDTVLFTFDHLTDATIYFDDDNYQRLFFEAPRRYIKKKQRNKQQNQ